MSYQKAANVLPQDLIDQIQNYVDGEYIYIPRKSEHKKAWGETTSTRVELNRRNQNIFRDYQNGVHMDVLSEKYYLSNKSIQRIVLNEKRKATSKN